MLVGNKSDDETKREVNAKTGEALQVSRVMEVPINMTTVISKHFGTSIFMESFA